MRGKNTIQLNQSTMKEVVQHWLNTRVLKADAPAQNVTHVEEKSVGCVPIFFVTVQEVTEEPKP